MRNAWEELVGSKADGYLLRGLMGSTERSAVYRTYQGEESASLKLVDGDEETATRTEVEHPHVIRLYTSGRADIGGSLFHYWVMEPAEENLASVIGTRALSPDETREMLIPVLEALSYLHERGLAHGRIRPSNILAVGDSVKLSVDSVRPVGAVASPEEDMRSLGLTIIEVLTQERQASGIAEVAQPLHDIVEHSLQPDPALRWTARQAAMRLSGAEPEAPAATVVTPVADAPGPAASVAEVRKRLIPVWVLPAAAVVMILAVIYTLARGTGSSSDSSLAASMPTASVPAANVPAPVARPQPVSPQPKPTPFDSSPRRAAATTGNGWFVVVASYAREVDARQEAGVLSRKFPQFKPTVFPPSAIDTHYLVILGSGFSQENAESLRQRAVASGLPADTYIKKYPAPRG